MGKVVFKNNIAQVVDLLEEQAIKFLYEAGGELQAQVQRNTRVDTGQLKNSWKHVVDERDLKVVVGSPLQNAIWEEFGTGEYAVNGDGRKNAWSYQDVKGEWHTTKGKKPSRALTNAYNKTKPLLEKRLEAMMKGK